MLASTSKEIAPTAELAVGVLTDADGWTFQPKWDGIRAVTTVGDHVTITNRRGVDITGRYPDVVAALATTGHDVTLDGEVVVVHDGRPDFDAAHLRDAQSHPASIRRLAAVHPATFVAFDLLRQDGVELALLPYRQRRARLEALALPPTVVLTPESTDGRAMWAMVLDLKLEGLVAKRLTSRYAHKRSRDWVKLKHTKRCTALVTGYTPGEGGRVHTIGALHLALLDANRTPVPIGRVGSGFTDRDLAFFKERLSSAAYEPLLVEVEYLDASPQHILRMPVYKHVRTDVSIFDCTLDQLQ